MATVNASCNKWKRLKDNPCIAFTKPEKLNDNEFMIIDSRNGDKMFKYNVKSNNWMNFYSGMDTGEKWNDFGSTIKVLLI